MKKQIIPRGYKDLTEEEHKKICNGMGSSQSKIDLVPDKFYGLDMVECGNKHDYGYHTGYSNFDKFMADALFLWNMIARIEEEKSKVNFLRKKRGRTYCKFVLVLGDSSYYLEEKGNQHLQPKFKGWFKWWKELRYENRLWKTIKIFIKDKNVTQENYLSKLKNVQR